MEAKADGRRKLSFAVKHMISAGRFARKSRQLNLPSDCNSEEDILLLDEARACVTASVFLAVAALEAYVNEEALSREIELETLRDPKRKGSRILGKYEKLLDILGKCGNTVRGATYHEAEDLIALRNCLVHFKPSWDNEDGEHKAMRKRFEARAEELGLASSQGGNFLDESTLSYQIADWAVKTVWSFVREFSELSHTTNRLLKHQRNIFGGG